MNKFVKMKCRYQVIDISDPSPLGYRVKLECDTEQEAVDYIRSRPKIDGFNSSVKYTIRLVYVSVDE